jgi:predicted Zn finger-like uncharacterized protein
MIVQCESCGRKYDLDESLLKEEGSKVRCTLCKHVFLAYPQKELFEEAEEPITLSQEDVEEIQFEDIAEEDLSEELPREVPVGAIPREPLDGEVQFDEVFAEPMEDTEEVDEAPGSPPGRVAKSRIFPLLMVAALLVFGSVGAIIFLAPHWIPDSFSFLRMGYQKPIQDKGIRRLSFESVNGSFIDTKDAKKRFVIRGKVINRYPKPRSFVRIKGSILDDKGQAIRKEVVYAGNVFTDEELRTLSLEKVHRAMKNRLGMGKKNVNVASDQNVRFMIVFEQLPENVSEFTVEAVSSSPGT